ncbi:MAG: hypothetical protein KTR28_00085 [Micavibrio sp.]|nr:hypothetical protein [Micavibrio sp.]
MSDEKAIDELSPPSNDLFAEDFEKTRDDLALLYIRNNQSGRINFAKKHPDLAIYLLGEDLMNYDREGVGENRDHRDALEEEAEGRHDALTTLLGELEENSTLYGSLQSEYVEGVVKKLGRELSLKVYLPKIVNRYLPPEDAPRRDDIPFHSDIQDMPQHAVAVDTPAHPSQPAPTPPEPEVQPDPAPQELPPQSPPAEVQATTPDEFNPPPTSTPPQRPPEAEEEKPKTVTGKITFGKSED